MSGVIDGKATDHGICIRAAIYMFSKAQSLPDSFAFRLSILEIYNETLVDLLLPSLTETSSMPINTATKANKLNIMETESGMLVPGLHIMPIDTVDDTIDHFVEAQANRAVAEHQLNHRSSRSHIIYTFYITRTQHMAKANMTKGTISSNVPATADEPIIHQSKLHLVDLAGSERVSKTGSSGIVQKEANYINRSLSYLEQVVIALGQSNRDHIPFRQSKLTQLLKDCLGGNCNTYMIACIWPKKDHSWETLSTLRFSARMKCIETQPIRNRLVTKEQAPSRIIQQQMDILKKELALRDMFHQRIMQQQLQLQQHINNNNSTNNNGTNNGGNTNNNSNNNNDIWSIELTKQQSMRTYQQCYEHLLQDLTSFPFDSLSSLPAMQSNKLDLHSLSQMQLMLNVYKAMILKLSNQNEGLIMETFADVIAMNTSDTIPLPRKQALTTTIAANTASTATAATISSKLSDPMNQQQVDVNESCAKNAAAQEEDRESAAGGLSLNVELLTEKRREEYFQEFITHLETGKKLHEAFEQSKDALKSNKQRQREIITLLNEQKGMIDELGQKLMHYGNNNIPPTPGGAVVGNGENENENGDNPIVLEQEAITAGIAVTGKVNDKGFEQLREQLEQAKKRYRTAHQELAICKEQISETQSLKKRAMNAMLTAFNEYLSSMPIVGEEEQTY